jgi:hypothetical protein
MQAEEMQLKTKCVMHQESCILPTARLGRLPLPGPAQWSGSRPGRCHASDANLGLRKTAEPALGMETDTISFLTAAARINLRR